MKSPSKSVLAFTAAVPVNQMAKTAAETYIRIVDGAKMVEIAPHQYVNETCLAILGRKRHAKEEAENIIDDLEGGTDAKPKFDTR
jgi:hypothetical protein